MQNQNNRHDRSPVRNRHQRPAAGEPGQRFFNYLKANIHLDLTHSLVSSTTPRGPTQHSSSKNRPLHDSNLPFYCEHRLPLFLANCYSLHYSSPCHSVSRFGLIYNGHYQYITSGSALLEQRSGVTRNTLRSSSRLSKSTLRPTTTTTLLLHLP